MAHLALYRKYRPAGFEELIGQDHIKSTILNAVVQKKFTHAYIFSGPRGSGKTSTAKLLAKAINCANGVDGEPCGNCDTCSDTNPDVIEIDAASNNGVDEIRDIRDKVRYLPNQSKYKVYIIDEVHMLTTAAFNALLKTLEEPPEHAVFILATTEPHKIPLTIVSRCQRYDFRRIPVKVIVERMETIIKQEGIEVEAAALDVIARVAQGGMRDALSLLDQAISHSDGKVLLTDVIAVTGTVSLSLIGEIISAIEAQNTGLAISLLSGAIDNGKEPKFLLDDLMAYYRDILLYRTIGEDAALSKAVMDESFKDIAGSADINRIYSTIDELNQCAGQIKFTSQEKITLEVALVSICTRQSSASSGNNNELAVLREELATLKAKVNALTEKSDRLNALESPKVIVDQQVQDESVTAAIEEPLNEDMTKEQIKPIQKTVVEEATKNMLSQMELMESESFPSEDVQQEVVVNDLQDLLQSYSNELENESSQNESAGKPMTFIDQVQQDIENEEDYIEVRDIIVPFEEPFTEPEPKSAPLNETDSSLSANPEDGEIEVNTSKLSIVEQVLNRAQRQHKDAYKAKETEVLSELKKAKMSAYSLYKDGKIRACAGDAIVISCHTESLVKLFEKVTNRSIIEEVISDVMDVETTVYAITDKEFQTLLKAFQKN